MPLSSIQKVKHQIQSRMDGFRYPKNYTGMCSGFEGPPETASLEGLRKEAGCLTIRYLQYTQRRHPALKILSRTACHGTPRKRAF